MKGSFALLLFVILGYMVKFYPETLVGFDQPIQTAVRGDLPDYLTILFRAITRLIDIPSDYHLGCHYSFCLLS